MGRKSAKGKEKKMKRKEEKAKILAAMKVVEAADKLEDPMATLLPFKKFNRNGLTLSIECSRVTDMDKDSIDWAFNLTKANMQTLYEQSNWGWTEREKREEMEHDKAWYLVAKDQDGCHQGFAQFRFDMDFDDEVLYCYEIQILNEVRRKGLGKFLMQILELIAHKTQMKKVMCTVFQNNKTATAFFTKNLKYVIDETSPSEYDPMNPEDYDYEILSKPIAKKEKVVSKEDEENKAAFKTAVEALS
ncbi:N-alpha-acetyltransferase 40-like [Amphiura filiformis]|uniref:N-alpha-acetyltransferase 40-like n=2 Tax=Amphiura filiformis TaxID=82378 RepID=UPI003B216277